LASQRPNRRGATRGPRRPGAAVCPVSQQPDAFRRELPPNERGELRCGRRYECRAWYPRPIERWRLCKASEPGAKLALDALALLPDTLPRHDAIGAYCSPADV